MLRVVMGKAQRMQVQRWVLRMLLTALLAGKAGLDCLLPSPVPAAVGSSESCQGHTGQCSEVRVGWFTTPIQHFLKAT